MQGKTGAALMEQIARTPKQIGAALRRRRRAAGFTQAALGAKTKLRQATISALENGEPGTRLGTLIDVMAALGLELAIRERTKAADRIEDVF
jgi:HTH-type transcriptional regulator/antitoxin HipB